MDSSGPAVALASRNAELNGLEGVCRFEKADISAFMAAAAEEGRTWDVVVLDPPKLAPSRASLQRATAKYRALNQAALKLVAPGGLLMTCTCSGAMTQSGAFPTCVAFGSGDC